MTPMQPMQPPRMDPLAMHEFVRDYCNGAIVLSTQVPQDLWGTVFMPITLGALHPPQEIVDAALEPFTEEKPSVESIPDMDTAKGAPAPLAPEIKTRPDKRDITTLTREAEWDAALEAALPAICEEEARLDALWDAQHQQAIEEHQRALEEHQSLIDKLELEHQALILEIQARNANFQTRLAEWTLKKEAYNTAHLHLLEVWSADIGAIFGNLNWGHTSGTAINGYPCFFTIALIHKLDYDILVPAIQKELARRNEPLF